MVNAQTPHLMALAAVRGRDGTGGFGPFVPAAVPAPPSPPPNTATAPAVTMDLNLTPGLSAGGT